MTAKLPQPRPDGVKPTPPPAPPPKNHDDRHKACRANERRLQASLDAITAERNEMLAAINKHTSECFAERDQLQAELATAKDELRINAEECLACCNADLHSITDRLNQEISRLKAELAEAKKLLDVQNVRIDIDDKSREMLLTNEKLRAELAAAQRVVDACKAWLAHFESCPPPRIYEAAWSMTVLEQCLKAEPPHGAEGEGEGK